MEYRLDFFDLWDHLSGSLVFDALNDEAALLVAEGFCKAASAGERRGELWNGERVVKLYPYQDRKRFT